MPHSINRDIAEMAANQCSLKNVKKYSPARSDNWWYVEDQNGRPALLYVMRYHSTSDEPTRVPNQKAAFKDLEGYYARDARFTWGPLFALAVHDSSTGTITDVDVWNLSSHRPLNGQISTDKLGPKLG